MLLLIIYKRSMKKITRNLIIGNLLLIAGVFFYLLNSNETLMKKGEVLVLKLAPADPRSFMMGDYMTLNYDINNEMQSFNFSNYLTQLDQTKKRFQIVVQKNDSLATYVGKYKKGRVLEKGEFLLTVEQHYFSNTIVPNEYLFQEGKAKKYNRAEYAQFRVDKSGNVIIECLLDKNRNQLK